MQRAALDVHNCSSSKIFGFDQQIGYCLDWEHPRVCCQGDRFVEYIIVYRRSRIPSQTKNNYTIITVYLDSGLFLLYVVSLALVQMKKISLPQMANAKSCFYYSKQ